MEGQVVQEVIRIITKIHFVIFVKSMITRNGNEDSDKG